MTPFETLNLWLPEDLPLYQKFKDLSYQQVNTGVYEKDKTFWRSGLSKKEFEPVTDLYNLIEKYQMVPKIFLLEPNTTYDWHADAFRYIAINCLLTHDDSDYLTLFCNDIEKFDMLYFKTKRLVYEPRRFYMFNSQVPHIVTNYSTSPRYLLTIAPYTGQKIKTELHPRDRDYSFFLKTSQEFKEVGLIS